MQATAKVGGCYFTGWFNILFKTLFFSLLLAILSYALFQPSANAASVELVPSTRVILKLTPEMTVDEIIRRVYPNENDLWPQIKQKLIEANPNSFQPNSAQLIPGTRLKLVDIKRIVEAEELTPKIKVGYVAAMSGSISAVDINDREQGLQMNSPIFEGDRLETGLNSSLHLLMDDGAEVFLKEDSVLKFSEYVITNGYDNSSSILDLLRGGLRKITGAIGASPHANYQLQTGLATIGIRGTEYVIKLCRQDDCSRTVSRNDADAKLHAVVLDGSITLTTDTDVQILMALGEYGSATREELVVEEQKAVPIGFLDAEEAQKFNVTIPQRLQQEEESANSWIWIVGILLLAVGL